MENIDIKMIAFKIIWIETNPDNFSCYLGNENKKIFVGYVWKRPIILDWTYSHQNESDFKTYSTLEEAKSALLQLFT